MALADLISYSQFGFLLVKRYILELGGRASIAELIQKSHLYTVQNLEGVPVKRRQERRGLRLLYSSIVRSCSKISFGKPDVVCCSIRRVGLYTFWYLNVWGIMYAWELKCLDTVHLTNIEQKYKFKQQCRIEGRTVLHWHFLSMYSIYLYLWKL